MKLLGQDWLDGWTIGLLSFMVASVAFYRFVIWAGVSPGPPSEAAAENVREVISIGVTAVSILLPLSIGIIGYLLEKQMAARKEAIRNLTSSAFFFMLSLGAALWNLFRLPGLAMAADLTRDWQTAMYQIIQLQSLFFGVLRLFMGSRAAVRS